jgi:hypothetical protein
MSHQNPMYPTWYIIYMLILCLLRYATCSPPAQAVLHDFVGRAAAVAGSLVHVGQSVPRAANLAEAIMDPADVVSALGRDGLCVIGTWMQKYRSLDVVSTVCDGRLSG